MERSYFHDKCKFNLKVKELVTEFTWKTLSKVNDGEQSYLGEIIWNSDLEDKLCKFATIGINLRQFAEVIDFKISGELRKWSSMRYKKQWDNVN